MTWYICFDIDHVVIRVLCIWLCFCSSMLSYAWQKCQKTPKKLLLFSQYFFFLLIWCDRNKYTYITLRTQIIVILMIMKAVSTNILNKFILSDNNYKKNVSSVTLWKIKWLGQDFFIINILIMISSKNGYVAVLLQIIWFCKTMLYSFLGEYFHNIFLMIRILKKNIRLLLRVNANCGNPILHNHYCFCNYPDEGVHFLVK